MGWASLACALAIFLVPVHYKLPLTVILALNASGDLGLYELYRHGFQYDKIIHFTSPLIATYALAQRMFIRRAVMIVLTLALGWELYEILADALIKTHLFGIYRHQVIKDTIMDIFMNILGITSAILIFLLRLRNHGRRTSHILTS